MDIQRENKGKGSQGESFIRYNIVIEVKRGIKIFLTFFYILL